MRPAPPSRSGRRARLAAEIASDLLFLAGWGAVAGAAWLLDPRIGLAVAGVIGWGVAFLITPRRSDE